MLSACTTSFTNYTTWKVDDANPKYWFYHGPLQPVGLSIVNINVAWHTCPSPHSLFPSQLGQRIRYSHRVQRKKTNQDAQSYLKYLIQFFAKSQGKQIYTSSMRNAFSGNVLLQAECHPIRS